MHQWVSPFIVASLAGMVVGMTVQMLLAMLAGSVLGSIESMVPTTMASMAATGFVCVLGLALPLTHDSGAWIGALVGVTTFAGMAWYRRCCDARFVRGDW